MVSKYKLEIVSLLDGFKERLFKKHDVNGKQTIGVSKGEPFFIRFKNNTSDKVQVKLAIDNIDVLSGKKAKLIDTSGHFWLVYPNSSLEIKAWPETNSGGAGFIFGEPGKGVAENTIRDTSGVGMISASVFVEGLPYLKYEPIDLFRSYPQKEYYSFNTDDILRGATGSWDVGAAGISYGAASGKGYSGVIKTQSLRKEEKVAVGAREYVQQVLTNVESFNSPVLTEMLEVKYEHWETLQKMLNKRDRINLQNVPKQQSLF